MEDLQTFIRNLTRKARQFSEERVNEQTLEQHNHWWLDGYSYALKNLDDPGVKADRERLARGETL